MFRRLAHSVIAALACAALVPAFAKEVPGSSSAGACSQSIVVNPTPPAITEVNQPCVVPASPASYIFHEIHIIGPNGALIFDDANGPIDFWAESILVENGGELRIGTADKPIGTS